MIHSRLIFAIGGFAAALLIALATPAQAAGTSAEGAGGAKGAGRAEQFVLKLSRAAGDRIVDVQGRAAGASVSPASRNAVSLIEEFRSDSNSYLVLSAAGRSALDDYLSGMKITPERVADVEFVNSPVLGGGQAAEKAPRTGHKVFVIERTIPGVGSLPISTLTKISKGSNAAIAKIGPDVEWDHSFLNQQGTLCVYRATDPEKIVEHGRLAGAPVDKVTEVEHVVHDVAAARSLK